MEQIEMKVSSTFKDVDLEKGRVELLHHQLEKKNEKLIQCFSFFILGNDLSMYYPVFDYMCNK
jgi:hypothetical protein